MVGDKRATICWCVLPKDVNKKLLRYVEENVGSKVHGFFEDFNGIWFEHVKVCVWKRCAKIGAGKHAASAGSWVVNGASCATKKELSGIFSLDAWRGQKIRGIPKKTDIRANGCVQADWTQMWVCMCQAAHMEADDHDRCVKTLVTCCSRHVSVCKGKL